MYFSVALNLLYGNNKSLYEIVTKYTYVWSTFVVVRSAFTLGGSFGPGGGEVPKHKMFSYYMNLRM